MSLHVMVRFEPHLGKELELREELLRALEATRGEPGCLAIRLFESIRDPLAFAVHSEWEDEAAFDLHAKLPHTVRLIGVAEKVLTHPIQALRLREIG